VTPAPVTPAPVSGESYDLTLDVSQVEPAFLDGFLAAKVRWEQVLVGDLPDINRGNAIAPDDTDCDLNQMPQIIDDVFMCTSTVENDGEGGILASAGVEFIRAFPGIPGENLPLIGSMEFDVADAQNLLDEGDFASVVLHEMGHLVRATTQYYNLISHSFR